MSLNFGGGGSRSNISSIVHLEEISQGYYSIDKQEYRIQNKVKNPSTKQINQVNTKQIGGRTSNAQ